MYLQRHRKEFVKYRSRVRNVATTYASEEDRNGERYSIQFVNT